MNRVKQAIPVIMLLMALVQAEQTLGGGRIEGLTRTERICPCGAGTPPAPAPYWTGIPCTDVTNVHSVSCAEFVSKTESETGVTAKYMGTKTHGQSVDIVYGSSSYIFKDKTECERCASGTCLFPGISTVGIGNSVDVRLYLGQNVKGESEGFLWIYTNQPGEKTVTPEGLRVMSEEADVVMDNYNTNAFRQVMSTECLADIITNSDRSYTVNFYHASDVNSTPDTNGYYTVKEGSTSFAHYTIENPSATNTDRLLVIGGMNGDILTNEFIYSETDGAKELSLSKGGLRYEGKSETTNETGRIITYTVREPDQTLVSKRQDTRRTFAWGEALTESAVDPDGLNLITTRSYHENVAETGKYSQIKLEVQSDGSWVRYDDYNTMGRVTIEVRSRKDVPANAVAAAARAIYSSYAAVDWNDDLSVDFWKPRTVREEIEGVVVSKKYYAYYKTVADELVEIEEECSTAGAAYGAEGNLRTKKVYYPQSETDVSPKKIKTHEYPDGRKDSYSYEYGSYVTNSNPSACYFDANWTGDFMRVTTVHGTTDSSWGITGKTTKETIVRNPGGRELMRETYVCQSETNYTRVAWVVSQLNALGQPVKVYKSNNTQSESTWGCCGKEYEKDENGVEYFYTYDALKRMTQRLKKGVSAGEYPAQADQYIAYTYDAEGRVLTEIITASSLSQGRTNQYDLAGRLINSSDFAGLVTTTAYSQDGLTTTEILPGGFTRIIERFKDGQVKNITGTAQISQYYEYGVNADGTKWAKVSTAAAGSPVWVKTTTDLFSRTAKVEKPTWTGTQIEEYSYNSKGQLVLRSLGEGGPATIFEYDAIGNQIRSGFDVNANGVLDLAGIDRISESDTSYEQVSGVWYLASVSRLYATDNSVAPITNSITRQRLTGFAANTIAETISVDSLGNQTVSSTVLDRANKKVTQTVDVPDSSSNIVTVAVNGLVQSQTSKTGLKTTFAYDALGRRTTVTDPRLGNAVTHYDSHGWVDYIEDAAGNRTTFTYDSATGRRLSQTDSMSNTSYSSYSSHGQLERTWGSASYPVSYEYDGYGRKIKQHTYRGGSGWSSSTWPASPGTADTTEWIYHEASGLLIAKKDAAGKQVSYTYDVANRLASRTWSRTVGAVPPNGDQLVTSYSYSPAGDLTGIDYSDSTPDVSFTYDRLGRQKTVTDALGVREFTYQILNLQSEIVPDGSGGTNTITRTYDSLGRPTGFNLNSDYQVAYGYDGLGRFTSASSASLAVQYSYLQNSDLISVISNGVLKTTRTYEQNRNLLTQIKNEVNSSILSQFDYANDNGGRRTSIKHSGSAFETGAAFNKYDYNNRSEVTVGDKYWGANLNDISDPVLGQAFAYAYDNIGNRTGASRDNEESIYTANNLNQYLQRTVPGRVHVSGSAKPEATVTINDLPVDRHDAYWHKALEVKNATKAAYPEIEVVGVYNPETEGEEDVVSKEKGHLFVARTPEKFTYDADGNMTQDGRFNYEWDCENRLIGVETRTDLHMKVPRVKVTFRYDYMGRRVMKEVHEWHKKQRWARKTVSSFLYDGWNLLEERKLERKGRECDDKWRNKKCLWFEAWEQLFADEDCEYCEEGDKQDKGSKGKGHGKCKHKHPQVNYYVWGLDLSGTLQEAGGIGGLLAETKSDGTYFPFADANGNITGYISTNGTIAAHYEYDVYGNLVAATGDHANDFAFLFQTEYFDREIGKYYWKHRYYDPVTGRFMSKDLIGEWGGLNLYAFVYNSPIFRIDPLGLSDKFPEEGGICCYDPATVESVVLKHGSTSVDQRTVSWGIEYKITGEYRDLIKYSWTCAWQPRPWRSGSTPNWVEEFSYTYSERDRELWAYNLQVRGKIKFWNCVNKKWKRDEKEASNKLAYLWDPNGLRIDSGPAGDWWGNQPPPSP